LLINLLALFNLLLIRYFETPVRKEQKFLGEILKKSTMKNGSYTGDLQLIHQVLPLNQYLRENGQKMMLSSFLLLFFSLLHLPFSNQDVAELAWSPNNEFLASCSLDNSIIIWNGSTFGLHSYLFWMPANHSEIKVKIFKIR